jgi:hypothetical protein
LSGARRELLTPARRFQLFAFPDDESELIRLATLSAQDVEFAPRIADRADKNLYAPDKPGEWPAFALVQQGTVTALLILRKLSAYFRENGLNHRLAAAA